MKYGVNLLIWAMQITQQHRSLLSSIRDWGFDGVELFLSMDEPADISLLRKDLDQLHLERTTCVVVPRNMHLPSPDIEVRNAAINFLNRCVERTADLGAHLMCGPLHSGLGVMTGYRRTSEEWKWSVECLQRVAQRANGLGVTLCVEPLNRFETYFLNTQEDAARFVDEISEPNVFVHYDTFHANIEE